MKKVARVLLWVGSNASLALLIWAGGFGGMDWAGNVVRFWAWFILVLALAVAAIAAVFFVVTALTDDAPPDPMPDRIVPLGLDLSVDLFLAFGMAAAGWFWTAGVFTAGNMISAMAFGVIRIADREARTAVEPATEHV